MDDLLKRAHAAAFKAHLGVNRKNLDIPYITHPCNVVVAIARHTNDVTILAAAMLHDVLEDTDHFIGDFPDEVLAIVKNVTRDKDTESKTAFITRTFSNSDAKVRFASALIKAADRADNVKDGIKVMSKDWWVDYRTTSLAVLNNAGKVLGSDHSLVVDLSDAISRADVHFAA